MYKETRLKDGRVLQVEIHICLKCTCPIVLNDERYYKMWIPAWKTFAYAHKNCVAKHK